MNESAEHATEAPPVPALVEADHATYKRVMLVIALIISFIPVVAICVVAVTG